MATTTNLWVTGSSGSGIGNAEQWTIKQFGEVMPDAIHTVTVKKKKETYEERMMREYGTLY